MGCRTKLFVAGVPGTGKTYTGNQLAERFGWVHVDVEQMHQTASAATFAQFLSNPTSFFPRVEHLVVTWGYIPEFAATAQRIVAAKFVPVWFTGDERHVQTVIERRGVNPASPLPANPYQVASRAQQFISGWDEIDVFNTDGTHIDVAQLLNDRYKGVT